MAYIGRTPTNAALTAADLADGIVSTAKIAADAVTDAKIADDVVGTEHLTANEVDTAALGADAVTGAQLADNAINSEHYTDGSIDTAHIAADQITNAKIADDQIDSEHYVDGSIDTAHIADDAITSAKLGTGDMTFPNGNLVFGTAAKGVYLGVTTATAANLLDDYEEGTWTPTFNRSSSQITIAILRANYTKIGRLVHVTMHAVNNDGAKNNANIIGDGLPFTGASINVLGVGGTFAIHPGSGNSNNDVGAAGSWTQDNDWYMVPSHNGTNGYRYLYDWANGAYIEVAFWYYAA